MTLTRKILSVAIAAVMLVCMSINAYALGDTKIVPVKESLKISTLPVPQAATEYAIMTRFIYLLSGVNYVTTGSTLSFYDIATLTYARRPSSIIYWPVVGNEYHTVVLAGFSYLSSDLNNVENQAYYIMDPNHPSSYIMVGYNTAYVDNDILEYVNGQYVHPIYLWSNTAVRNG